MSSSYKTVIDKLDAFIRKYYKNLIIKGTIYFCAVFLAFYLILTLGEYWLEFGTTARTILFFSFISINLTVLGLYVIRPILKLMQIGSRISHNRAAQIIGEHFRAVEDKLTNILELNNQLENRNNQLLIAAIDQKSFELKPIPFSNAIDVKQNKKYLKYVIPTVFVLFIVYLIAPGVITKSTTRLVQYNKEFVPEAYFKFNLINKNLNVPQNEDITIQLKLVGKQIPSKVYIIKGGLKSQMKKNNDIFEYNLNSINKNISFVFEADGYNSKTYNINVIKVPTLSSLNIEANFPKYLNRKTETFSNNGNLNIPEGTKLNFQINTKNTEEVYLLFPKDSIPLNKTNSNSHTSSYIANKNTNYNIVTKSKSYGLKKGLPYTINIIKDEYPTIELTEKTDSILEQSKTFTGTIKDDHGLTQLKFYYKKGSDKWLSKNITINNGYRQDVFFYYWDLKELGLKKGESLSYYFQVWDNDGYNGRKSTKSNIKKFKTVSNKELNSKKENQSNNVKDILEKNIDEAKKLQENIKNVNNSLLNKKSFDWKDKKEIEKLVEQQKQLEKNLEKLKEENKKLNELQKLNKEENKELQQKKEELDKLIEELMSDELKEMLKELEELMQEMNKDQLENKMNDIQQNNNQLEKELDRTLELFKRMEVEQKLDNISTELDKLSEEQEKLSEETKEKGINEETKEKQKEINESIEDLKKEIEKLNNKNNDLKNPMDFDDMKKESQSLDESLKNIENNIDQNKKKKTSESQKNAAEKMKKMSQSMKNKMNDAQAQQQQEDMEDLRQLLDNLITLSFEQESIINETKDISTEDPYYFEIGKKQKTVNSNFKHVEDSLLELATRVVQIQSSVYDELTEIHSNQDLTIKHIGNRKTQDVLYRQQLTMTSYNNLALLLDDALQQMQQAMQQAKPGSGECNKPGGNNPKDGGGVPDMKQLQEQLGKQLEELKKGMQKGNKPGPGKPAPGLGIPGQNGQLSEQQSKKLSQLAKQQAQIKEQLDRLAQSKLGEGTKGKELSDELKKIAEEMNKLEKDILNRNINNNTIERHKEIMSKLLEAENAEREQEYDNKRKAEEAKTQEIKNSEDYKEYLKLKEKEIEFIKSLPVQLKPYYRRKYLDYVN